VNGTARIVRRGEVPFVLVDVVRRVGKHMLVRCSILKPAPTTSLLSDELIRDTEQQMPRLVRELRENLDSTSTDTFMNFLSAAPKRLDIPKRCGYYIGMLVARETKPEDHSLRETGRAFGISNCEKKLKLPWSKLNLGTVDPVVHS